jgi:predicted dehydrogenase
VGEDSKRVSIAVVGAGKFGEQHARVLHESPNAELVAVVDKEPERARLVAERFGCKALTDLNELPGLAAAATLAVPTLSHAEVGVKLLEAGLDLLVEKPIAADLASADALIDAARRSGRILQVGHLERFNPAVEAACKAATLPLFFEVHRLGSFSLRSLDVDVVLDLMIHDLDIILRMVRLPVERIEATGLPILSSKADICSVRLVFQNGCVANLTASRISFEKVRKLRFFQPRQYVSIDYTRQDGVVCGIDQGGQLQFQPMQVEKAEPLARQMEAFLEAVRQRGAPRVSGEEAREALALALRIIEEMERHSRVVGATLAARPQ